MTIETFLRESIAALDVTPRLVWIDEATLKAREIDGMVPWILARGNDLGHTTHPDDAVDGGRPVASSGARDGARHAGLVQGAAGRSACEREMGDLARNGARDPRGRARVAPRAWR